MNSIGGITQTGGRTGERGRRPLRHAFAVHRAPAIVGGAMLITFLATLVAILVDPGVITGAPAWLKPAKFAISISVYCFTFVWLLGFVENRPRLVRLAANVTAVGVIVEMIAIITQAARGTTSHFNMTAPLNSFLWLLMGALIVLVWAMNFLLAIMLILQRMPDRAFAWSLRLGVLISSIGMATAFLMVTPTREQAAAIAAGSRPGIIGAHSVGVADGGPGLPVVGWSTVGGDLRIPHFVGLHALQLLPLLGWWLMRRKDRTALLSSEDRLAVVWTSALAYLGLVLLLTWQALRGQSFIHPDSKTIAAAGGLVLVVAFSLGITITRALQRNRRRRVLTSAIQILSHEEDL